MISSYYENSYGEVIKSLVISQKPTRIIEFGILHGYSTLKILEGLRSAKNFELTICDIFDDFKYNRAEQEYVEKMFKEIENLTIRKINFFNFHLDENISFYDMIFIDIGNTYDTYKYFIEEIFPLIRKGSIVILEGGSPERDIYYINRGYHKEYISKYLGSLTSYNFITLDKFPSMTIFKK